MEWLERQPKVTCQGFRRMWITYSCQLGYDRTTANTKRPLQIATSPKPNPGQCHRRAMVSRDVPLDSGWIKIRCIGSCPIVINKVLKDSLAQILMYILVQTLAESFVWMLNKILLDRRVTYKTWFYQNFPSSFLFRIQYIEAKLQYIASQLPKFGYQLQYIATPLGKN